MKILIKTDTFMTHAEAQKIVERIKGEFEEGFVQVPTWLKIMIITDDGKVYTI